MPYLTSYLGTLTAGTDELRRATDRRDELLSQQKKRGGVQAVLSQSALQETQARRASSAKDKVLVAGRRAALPA